MKTFCLIICLLMLALSQQVASAQQQQIKEEPAEDFVKLEIPLEEALTKTTFVVEWLSGDGSTEVNFQGENVIRTPDYIELRSDEDERGRSSYYRVLPQHTVEGNRYIFVPLAQSGGGSGVLWNLHIVDKKTLRTVDTAGLGDRARIEKVGLAVPNSDTVSITYIKREVIKGKAVHDLKKAITKHFRMIQGTLQEVETPMGSNAEAITPKISEEPDVIFQLVERLQFADGTAVKSIAKDDIDALRDRPIRLGPNDHIDGVTLTNEKGEDIQVRTCREYDDALKRGYYANTNFDAQMSMWFMHQCGLLNALEGAAAPRQSYISNPKVGITNLELMPFSVFPYASDEEIKSGATFQTKIKNGELRVVEKNQNTLTTEEIDTGQFLQEVVRADFNDDGIEDIFLFEYHYSIRGTFGSGGIIVLTRKSVDGKFEVVRPSNPAQSSGHPYWFD